MLATFPPAPQLKPTPRRRRLCDAQRGGKEAADGRVDVGPGDGVVEDGLHRGELEVVGAVGTDEQRVALRPVEAGRQVDLHRLVAPQGLAVDLLLDEVQQVDGVDVEDIRLVADALHDPRLDALETAAMLVGASTATEAIEALCAHAARSVGANWAAVLGLESGTTVASEGAAPDAAWLLAFVEGSQSSARVNGDAQPDVGDVAWSPMPAAGMALVLGRDGQAFRARERRQAAALARIGFSRRWRLTIVMAKIGAHWLTSGFALVLLAPVLALQYGLPFDTVCRLTAALLLGTPVLSLIGSMGAALTLGVRGGGMLLAVLVLPLETPVLIFGANAADPSRADAWSTANFSLLGASLLAALALCPIATVAALRISSE